MTHLVQNYSFKNTQVTAAELPVLIADYQDETLLNQYFTTALR